MQFLPRYSVSTLQSFPTGKKLLYTILKLSAAVSKDDILSSYLLIFLFRDFFLIVAVVFPL